MLWIALHLPCLSLEAFAATLGSDRQGLPLALLQGIRLAQVDHQAASLGLAPGQKRATAMALAPHTIFGHADAPREAELLRAVAHAALAFTPSVTLADARTVLLEVASTQRAFGGLEHLIEQLQAAAAPLVPTRRVAVAPTAGGAAALARWGRDLPLVGAHSHSLAALGECLDDAPLALLPAAHEHLEALQGMGLRTWAELRALPRDGLARRFGPQLLAELDAARGEAAQAHEWLTLPEAFESRLELFARADTTEQVLYGAGLLLMRLVAWARSRRARVARFTLAMLHEPRHRHDDTTPERSTLQIALAEPANEAEHLAMLLRERLARMPLPAPTLELRLQCRHLAFSEAPNGELFASRASRREGLLRLIERLQARLGRECVRGVQRVADHRPERATLLAPLDPATAARAASAARSPTAHLTRPVWLFAEPRPLADRSSLPWLEGHPLQLLAGPERIEAGWWDGAVAARDYFVAQAHDGSLVWIYRARLPIGQPQGAAWFLQGRFA
jgi:protein ImuB